MGLPELADSKEAGEKFEQSRCIGFDIFDFHFLLALRLPCLSRRSLVLYQFFGCSLVLYTFFDMFLVKSVKW